VKNAAAVLGVLLLMTACFSGHVIEIKMPLSAVGARAAQEKIILDSLHEVAQELGMHVDEPIRGPGERVDYVAKYGTSAVSGFFISVAFMDHISIVFRSLEDVPEATAERAFALFKQKLDQRGLTYTVRRV
jgi:hypothetical protein